MSTEQSPQPSDSPPQEDKIVIDPEREIRFAVVMYGGVSLAIYINGVAQELLSMVRATAQPSDPASKSNADEPSTAGVYRKLARYLDERDGFSTKDGAIHTRFIVDVISGTSAGGINGVFLAKALARNQNMEGLRKLWLREGDLNKLLNDAVSVSDLAGFAVRRPQQSLLNSQRMYRKLLEALEQMDPTNDSVESAKREKTVPALVGELDLFITTTDLEGLPLPIALADSVVYERRHRNVFHFRYDGKGGGVRDDFTLACDPFLAYAARCTSSFPFAFEPMCLADIESITRGYHRYRNIPAAEDGSWDRFFSEYLRLGLYDIDKRARAEPAIGLADFAGKQEEKLVRATKKLREGFWSRAFGDGGYLDNKPFSYATAKLMRRYSTVAHVERKLLYVEPTPEHPELAPENRARPDFAENVRAAVLDLPRQETIREDIERIYERNRVIQRVTTFAREVDNDVILAPPKPLLGHAEFCKFGVGKLMEQYDIGYGAYHRLKVGEITSFIAEIVTRALGHDPESDAGMAIREAVAAWRRDKYKAVLPVGKRHNGTAQETENQFLVDHDLPYRLRRVIFLTRRVNEFLHLDTQRGTERDSRIKRGLAASLDRIKDSTGVDTDLLKTVRARLDPALNLPDTLSEADFRIWTKCFRSELKRIKQQALSPALDVTRATEEQCFCLEHAPKAVPEWDQLRDALAKLDLPWSELKELLYVDDEDRSRKADAFARNHMASFDTITGLIKQVLQKRREEIKNALRAIKKIEPVPSDLEKLLKSAQDPVRARDCCEQARLSARLCVADYDKHFVCYDMVIYPVQYGTGAGEANVVDVFRVSPEDATSLIDERRTGEERRKLAGRALMSFGAFLDRGWRKNDMMWGRLDGAERLISTLLPVRSDGGYPSQRQKREEFIKEAQIAILDEEIHESDVQTLQSVLSHLLERVEPSSVEERRLREVVQTALAKRGGNFPGALGSTLREVFQRPEEIHEYYQKHYEVSRQFEAETAARLIARATNITGQMLEDLANKCAIDPAKRAAEWVTRLGSVFWKLVIVAVPNSLANLFVRHWLGLFYLLSFIALALGIVLPTGSAMKTVGWQALGITVALNLIVFLMGDFIAGSRRWLRAFATLAVLTIAALIAIGAHTLWVDLIDYSQVHPKFVPEGLANFTKAIHPKLLAGIAGGLILLTFVCKEWLKGLRTFLAAPHWSFNTRRLFLLTVFSAAVCLWLDATSPTYIIDLEFGSANAASKAVTEIGNVRRALIIDYLFIVLYVATYASYCVAAAKLFWRAIDAIEERRRERIVEARKQNQQQASSQSLQKPQQPQRHLLSWPQVSRCLVAVGFFLAAAQCIAGLADVGENSTLLWYLAGHENQIYLMTARACATVKFALIGAGLFYSGVGFFVGIVQTSRNISPWVLVLWRVFAGVSFVGGYFALKALLTHPQLFQDIWPSIEFLLLG